MNNFAFVPVSNSIIPSLVTAAGDRASMRSLEFFAAQIRNPHTRRAYARAAGEFLDWCAAAGVPSIAAVHQCISPPWPERGRGARTRRAEREATARRDQALVRLAGDRPGGADQPSCVRAWATARRDVHTLAAQISF
jgi:hypothetical protein